MDVHAFLEARVIFLRQLYKTTTSPYIERKRLIESGEPPFEPPYSEDGEPPFLAEWLEADQSLRVLGQMFISALAATLQLYLKESLTNLRRRVRHQKFQGMRPIKDYDKTFKSEGWFAGYQRYFEEQLGVDFCKSECDLNVLEGLVLARNRSQHPDTITTLDVRHSEHDLRRIPDPFFVDAREMELIEDDQLPSFFIAPTITAKEKKIETAFTEVEKFCSWIEKSISNWSAT